MDDYALGASVLKKSVCFVSLGCAKNRVDSENMIGTLIAEGYELTTDETACDLLVINTCGFIEPAKRESLAEIARAIRRKNKRSHMSIIVAGCLVQRYPDLLADEFPEIDAFIGVHDIHRIADLAEACVAGKRPVYVSKQSDGEERILPRHLTTPAHMAYIKISEGCDNRCSYCAIPLIRGPMISRSMHLLVDEAHALSELGVKELIVVAQDPTRYGLDMHGSYLLPELVARLASIRGIEWIRLMYAHPARTGVLLDALTASDKVLRYADIPVQHASHRVLRLMGRGGDRVSLLERVDAIRRRIPDISLRSTFMVGFPGETAEDFAELLEFIGQAAFEHAGVFKYSSEDDTPAAAMPRAVESCEAERRFNLAMRAQQRVAIKQHQKRLGSAVRFVVESVAHPRYTGRTEFQAPEIDGVTRLAWTGQSLAIGDIVDVVLESVEEHDFHATGSASR